MKYIPDMLWVPQIDKEIVYHYTNLSNLMSIINNSEYWVTNYRFLNDKDELTVAKEVFSEVCRAEGIDKEIVYQVNNYVDREMLGEQDLLDCYIFSCSLESDSQLLWLNYANGDGVNIAINVDLLKKSFKSDRCLVWDGAVIYSAEEQYECIEKALRRELLNVEEFGSCSSLEDMNNLSNELRNRAILHMSVICELYSMFFKRECFCNEKEYRIIFSRVEDNRKQFRMNKNTIVPYIKVGTNSNEYIVGVNIGPTNNSELSMFGLRDLLKTNSCDVSIGNSNIPLRY